MALSTRFLAEKEQMLAHLDVLQELYPSLTHEQYDQELELMLPHNYGQLAVFDDEQCVAICGFWIGNKLWIGKYLELDNIVVCEAHRSKGLGELIFKRILVMLINEAADALYFKIATVQDIDLAMTKGVNYPKGLLKWADDLGIENIVNDLKKLYLLY